MPLQIQDHHDLPKPDHQCSPSNRRGFGGPSRGAVPQTPRPLPAPRGGDPAGEEKRPPADGPTGLPPGKRAIGFSALKGGGFLVDDVRQLQREYGCETTNWTIELDYHFGGFARRKPVLDEFIADFAARHRLVLDWVYPAKMMYGIFALAERGAFAPGTTLVALITG